MKTILKAIINSDTGSFLYLKFLLHFNKMIGRYGQNTFCKKSDVELLVIEVGQRWGNHPVAKERFKELLISIENLKV